MDSKDISKRVEEVMREVHPNTKPSWNMIGRLAHLVETIHSEEMERLGMMKEYVIEVPMVVKIRAVNEEEARKLADERGPVMLAAEFVERDDFVGFSPARAVRGKQKAAKGG